jgi:hypothetical protein
MNPEIYTLIGICINAIALIVIALINRKVLFKVEEVRHATNSMKDEMVKSARKEGFQDGKEVEIAKQDIKNKS